MTLDVRDDGAGFDPRARPGRAAGGGFGLIAMRQRVNRLAGQLEIESEPGARHRGLGQPARHRTGGALVTGPIRLLIADDHPVVRDGLRGIFEASDEFEVVGEAARRPGGGRPGRGAAARRGPDGPAHAGAGRGQRDPAAGRARVAARVLVLTTFDTDTDVVPAIEAGATGYLLKDSPPDELMRGVRAAARGEAVLSPSVATRLLGQVGQPAREPLSQRELDILGLIARGCSNREAAARLFISEATVKTHVLHIYAKLGVNDRAAAVAAGFERGLLPRP